MVTLATSQVRLSQCEEMYMNYYKLSVGLGPACTILPTEHLAYSTIYTATHTLLLHV